MPIIGDERPPPRADVVIAGTGFAATFFLAKLLAKSRPSLRVTVLEKGEWIDHQGWIARRGDPSIAADRHYAGSGDSGKQWKFSIGVGGSSNCWVGNTPRMLPDDFESRSLFGVGSDWPFAYADLEPYYVEAEQLMQVAGRHHGFAPSSAAYPLPPHRPSLPEVALARAWPGLFGPMPTARASKATPTRGPCCGNGVCTLCPVQAKFTILGDMMAVYDDPRVRVYSGTEVVSVETKGGHATGFRWAQAGGHGGRVQADHMVLATNALFNAAILKRSGDRSQMTGKRLHEQIGIKGDVYLDKMDSFQGSTYVTGLGLNLYADRERRKTMAPALIETNSVGLMRADPGRARQIIPVRMVFEDLPQERNEVRLAQGNDERPIAHFEGISDYAQRAIKRALQDIEKVFAPLPVERIELGAIEATESHILGTTVMGHSQDTSVTDQDGLHHRWRDLRILGSSLFPTGAPANPTLTLSAHALRAADRMEAIGP